MIGFHFRTDQKQAQDLTVLAKMTETNTSQVLRLALANLIAQHREQIDAFSAKMAEAERLLDQARREMSGEGAQDE